MNKCESGTTHYYSGGTVPVGSECTRMLDFFHFSLSACTLTSGQTCPLGYYYSAAAACPANTKFGNVGTCTIGTGASICKTCASGTYSECTLENTRTTDTTCPSMLLIDSFLIWLACNSAMPGCAKCTVSTACEECSPGFYLNSENTCTSMQYIRGQY